VGPCRVLAEGGCLGGLLAPRFLSIFAACLFSLLGKGIALASPFGVVVPAEQKVQVAAIILATIFLPGLLLGLSSCWHRGILKTFLAHPSILLMPTFTHFTFASSTKWSKGCSKEEEGEQQEGGDSEEPFIIFSAKVTILNILLSIMGSIAYCLSMRHIAGWDKLYRDSGIPYYLFYYLARDDESNSLILVPIFGLLLTLLSLAVTLTSQTCCSRPRPNSCFTFDDVEIGDIYGDCYGNCYGDCYAKSEAKVEHGALLTSKPHLQFVQDDNGKPKLVPEEEEVKIEETEMVDSEGAVFNFQFSILNILSPQLKPNIVWV